MPDLARRAGHRQSTEMARQVRLLQDERGASGDVILSYQPVIELPAADVRVGMRVSAVWASPAEEVDTGGGGMGGAYGSLLGWIPDGRPDLEDPDLVNRIF